MEILDNYLFLGLFFVSIKLKAFFILVNIYLNTSNEFLAI